MSSVAHSILNFDVDKILNPFIPQNQVKRVPNPISHWLGYRAKEPKEPPTLISNIFAFIGAFAGLIVVGAIYNYAPGIKQYGPPQLIASLGASAVLEYGAIYTPLAQPRNSLVGHALSAIIGVAISKGFQQYSNFDEIRWVAGALACAVATFVMSLTNTVHPPGGATALIACVQTDIVAMGWWLVPVITVATTVMLAVALINNNIARRFPVYWWTSAEVGGKLKRHKQQDEEEGEKQDDAKEKGTDGSSDTTKDEHDDTRSDTTLHPQISNTSYDKPSNSIHLDRHQMKIPANLKLSEQELIVLHALRDRMNHLT